MSCIDLVREKIEKLIKEEDELSKINFKDEKEKLRKQIKLLTKITTLEELLLEMHKQDCSKTF